ncbi:WXG100 family type VII secretion target [Streptomyces clavuligerus]|uniref:Uncharacterized protein n=1 Tax=Streptomyces clavuligerus TaxID=1901 RepID=B5H1T9_STRCL|nr:hypothetical protein [Streptomyces clavuligerus]ANW17774.1 hypothetical protein BB341_05820 [Streptomyces clavuligerus]AXU12326.1 hypothetical protein D1794_06035 [Streptomyces clavuligerus]EDY52535.1 hypothetical protein SSCG_05588 [Streptomyces clavuligerus]EFG09691.1 Hypothetical protein SCLAV_4619 [Streptomyces clavuligerus]MBY6302205.1 hypothetical protein [Streptomyces clavuligerus]
MGENARRNLTPEQRQTADTTRIETQYAAVDVVEEVTSALGRIGFADRSPGGFFGRTDFENARLNDMLDLVETADPADLESAGDALERATRALNRAAESLKGHVDATEWKGVGATEFQRYGRDLVRYASDLATYANAVGSQMKVASEGLTSVRNSKPPRDGRADPRRAEDFPPDERTQDNPEYTAAVKAEKHRQEAINQLNRLASYYAVSAQSLAAQEPPRMPRALAADVPRPRRTSQEPGGSEQGAGRAGPVDTSLQPRHGDRPEAVGTRQAGSVDTTTPSVVLPSSPSTPSPGSAMKLDNATAPPLLPSVPSTPPVTSPGGPSATSVTPVLPVVPGLAPNKAVPGKAVPGVSAGPKTVGGGPATPAAGRPGTEGAGKPVARRNEAAERAGVVGGTSAFGRGGSVGPVTSMGQQGPVAGRAAGRADGIVGGTPQRAASGAPGAFRGVPASNGIVGTPRGDSAASRSRTSGPSTGGVGPVGGRPGHRQPMREEEGNTSTRPDYLTEDEDTWAVRRRVVPPVIE